jgi:hypothetical protein
MSPTDVGTMSDEQLDRHLHGIVPEVFLPQIRARQTETIPLTPVQKLIASDPTSDAPHYTPGSWR